MLDKRADGFTLGLPYPSAFLYGDAAEYNLQLYDLGIQQA